MKREIILFRHYFSEFYEPLDIKTKKKVNYIFNIVRELDRIPEQYFKHLEGTDALYEIRIKLSSNIYRVICFFDRGNLVVLLNGFVKKTQKTPKNEIELAEKLKKEYYYEKSKN